MDKATEFVLTGGSAGGLSTFLHADRVAARLEAEVPTCKKIRAAPVVGYFLDHLTFSNSSGNVPNGQAPHEFNKASQSLEYQTAGTRQAPFSNGAKS